MTLSALLQSDAPFLRIYLEPMKHANANANASVATSEAGGGGDVNISTANVTELSSDSIEMDGALYANASRVEVSEGHDVTLTFVTESYPPIRTHHWATPTHLNHTGHQSYGTDGFRSEQTNVIDQTNQINQISLINTPGLQVQSLVAAAWSSS